MKTLVVDAHAHLDQYSDSELPDVLRQVEDGHIFTISTAMNPDSYRRARMIAARCRYVLPTFGLHPWEAHEYVGKLAQIDGLIETSPMLGEIGLDYQFVQDASRYGPQKEILEHFVRAAREQAKVVNLHTKGAEEEILGLLTRYEIERAIVHWYSGPLDVMAELAEVGCYFTVGVEVLRSDHIRQIAGMIPEDGLLIETDNPGGWEWLTGERGLPVRIQDVLGSVADIRHTPEEHIAAAVNENFARLIQDDPWLTPVHDEFF